MEVNNWCNSGCQDIDTNTSNRYGRIISYDELGTGSKTTISPTPRWRLLWRRIKKGKKKVFDCSSTRVHFSYDPYGYSQNFDQGSLWSDPDNISRSFSARFAVPSRIFDKSSALVA